MMMPGPASAIVTLLPRNRPTPIAPPMAIIESWREFRRRCSSPDSCGGWTLLTSVCETEPAEPLAKQHLTFVGPILQFRFGLIARDSPQHIDKLANLLYRVVVAERRPYSSAVWRNPHAAQETGRVHISISLPDPVFRTEGGHLGGRHSVQIETNCRHTVLQLTRLADSVDDNIVEFRQGPQGFGGQHCFVRANGLHGSH